MSPLTKYFILELTRFCSAILFLCTDLILYGLKISSLFRLRREFKFTEAIVIGGGFENPDLKELVTKNPGAACIGLNRYALSSSASKIVPNLYLLVDPYFFDLVYPDSREICDYLKTNRIPVLVPAGAPREYISYLRSLDVRVYYFNGRFSRILGFSSPILPRATVGMSLLMALIICKFLKIKNIFLVGFKSDLFKYLNVRKDNTLILEYPSFGGSNRKVIGTKLSQYFLGQYFFFYDLEKFSREYQGNVTVVGETMIDCFKRK